MKTNAVNDEASAASTIEEAIETGFLPDDPYYRMHGKFADTKEASAASTTKETEQQDEEEIEPKDEQEQPGKEAASAATSKESDTAAASEAASTQEKKGQQKTAATSESRWQKISRENRELREENARIKGRDEGRQASQRDTQQTSQPATEAATTSKTNPKPSIDDLDPKTNKPKFATYQQYEAAKDDWIQSEAIRKFQETSEKTQRADQQANNERILKEGFAKKLEPAQKKYADFDQVALNEDLCIPRGSVVDGFLLDSDHAGEVLYYLGQHPEILEGFYGNHDPKTGKYVNKVTPFAQARELTKIELKIAGLPPTPVKRVTQAPPPPHQVSTKGTVQKDAVEQAVEESDSDAYIREANARDPRIRALRKGK